MQPDLGIAIPELVGICGLIIILLTICQVDSKKIDQTVETGFLWSPAFIFFWAAVVRMLFLWRLPELSDDIYRYLFDGLMTVAGTNPYMDAPANVNAGIGAAMPQIEELIPLINHSHLVTIYPPAAQAVFAFGVLIGKILGISSLAGMKLVLVMLDLLTCAIIIKILTLLNLSKRRAVLYAWHPLPVLEIAGSGHIDAAAIFFLMAAIGFVIFISLVSRQGRGGTYSRKSSFMLLAGVLMAFSILTKWLPLIFLPCLLLTVRSAHRRYFLFGCLTTAGLLILPFLPEFINGVRTLSTYLQDWEFSGFAFRQLRQWFDSGNIARLVLMSGFIIIAGMVYWHVQIKKSHQHMFNGFFTIAFAYLVMTPTLHPWYALYLTAFLPFFPASAGRAGAGLILSWSVFLAYRVLIPYRMQGIWIEDDITAFIIVVAPAASFLSVLLIRILRIGLRTFVDNGKTPVSAS